MTRIEKSVKARKAEKRHEIKAVLSKIKKQYNALNILSTHECLETVNSRKSA